MDEIKNFPVSEGVNFSYIRQNHFKTGLISVNIFLPLNRETASRNAILPSLLTRSCKKYPDFTSLNKKLDDLYGANLGGDINRLGETQVLSLSASFLADKYALHSEKISAEIAELLCESLFNPKLNNNIFFKEDFEQERRQLIEQIDSEYNDKKIYARIRARELMCANEKFSINPLGDKKSVLNLTSEEVFNSWKKILKNAQIEIMMLGNSEPESALSGFKKAFSNISRENIIPCSTEVIKKAEKVQEIEEKQDVTQSKLVLGFRSGISEKDGEDFFTSRVMTALFGGSPHSKLFLNVREKLSLCYYCAASYDKQKGLIMVESGVQKENIQKAKKEILHQLEEIKSGNFTEEEIKTTKMSLKNTFISVQDSLSKLETFYTSQKFDIKKYSPKLYAEKIEEITKDQIIKAANSVTLDTIYSLTN